MYELCGCWYGIRAGRKVCFVPHPLPLRKVKAKTIENFQEVVKEKV